MTGGKYVEVLEEKLLPSIADIGLSEPILLDDSARPHRTSVVKNWLEEKNINRIDWPGNSPDLNPIENLWGIIKSKLRRIRIYSKQELLNNFDRIWTKN